MTTLSPTPTRESVEALAQARITLLGDTNGAIWDALIEAGWTPNCYAAIRRLAEHAATLGNPIAIRTPDDPAQVAAERMTDNAEWAADDGIPFAEVMPWLALVTATADRQESIRLRSSIRNWAEDRPENVPCGTWTYRVGPLGALAWAAGLSIEEASLAAAAGTLDETRLRTLAGLRGWRLPTLGPGVERR